MSHDRGTKKNSIEGRDVEGYWTVTAIETSIGQDLQQMWMLLILDGSFIGWQIVGGNELILEELSDTRAVA